MRFPSIRVFALLSGLAVAGCGAANINHCNGTGDCTGGNGGTGGGGGTGGTGGTGGGGGTGGSGGGGSTNCGTQNFNLMKGGTPDLLIVQDRSGSMEMDASGGNSTPSKWTSITAGIEQVVGQVSTVDWGLMFFGPTDLSFNVSSTPQVACGASTSSAITSAIMGTMPLGGTPTNEAIDAAVTYFKGNTDGNAHYILLATDGLPQCDTDDDSAAAETSVTNALNAGIKTIVVGIGNDPMGTATLTAMANNGGMPDTTGTTPYYQVNSTTDLVTALGKITGAIVSCNYPLTMAPTNPNYVEIDDENGNPIPHDTTHMNGWDYGPNDMSIIFYGMACTDLQMGVTTSITAVFGCPPPG